GTLLEDGLGDTVRVSLTEEPEVEAPVAQIMVDRYDERANHDYIPTIDENPIDPFQYQRRATREVLNIGGKNVPRVIADISQLKDPDLKDLKGIGYFYMPLLDKWKMNDLGSDYIYSADNPVSFMLPNGLKEILDYQTWLQHEDHINKFPLLSTQDLLEIGERHVDLNFIKLSLLDLSESLLEQLKGDATLVVLLDTDNQHAMADQRRLFFALEEKGIDVPVIIMRKYPTLSEEKLQLYAGTDIGGLLIDGLGDGAMLSTALLSDLSKEDLLDTIKVYNNTAFGILQAARTRMSKTEYISCPSCGRTLFDLQETTAMIRKRTDHLKGVK